MPNVLALLLAAGILLLGLMTCVPLLREKAVQKRAHLQLEEDLRTEHARTRELEERIAAVKTDPATVEKLAREKFGLAKPGEVIFKFRGDLPLSPPAAPGPVVPAAPSPRR